MSILKTIWSIPLVKIIVVCVFLVLAIGFLRIWGIVH
jgi:hypothetical protein